MANQSFLQKLLGGISGYLGWNSSLPSTPAQKVSNAKTTPEINYTPMPQTTPNMSTPQGTSQGQIYRSNEPGYRQVSRTTPAMQSPLPVENKQTSTTPIVPQTTTTPISTPQPNPYPKTIKSPEVKTETEVPQLSDATDIMQGIISGQNFTPASEDALGQARGRIKAMDLLSQQDPKLLAQLIESGRFSRADTLISDIAKFKPEVYAQIRNEISNQQTLDYLSNLTKNILKTSTKVPLKDGQISYTADTEIIPSGADNFNMATMNKLQEMYGDNAGKYIGVAHSILQSPEIQSQANKLKEATLARTEIETQLNEIEDDIRQQLGSEIPESITGAYIARQTKGLTNKLRSAVAVETAENDMLKSLRDDAFRTMDYFIKGQQMDFQQQQFEYQQEQDLFNNQLKLEQLRQSATPEWQESNTPGVFYKTGEDGDVIFSNSPTQYQSNITPSGNMVSINIPTMHKGGITATVDSIAAEPLQQAFQEMARMGLKPAVNQAEGSYRTSEQQKALYEKLHGQGATVAKPGSSNHEKGLAIDISNVTPEMAAIMNKYGWYQTAGSGDMGHFDYLGTQSQQQNTKNLDVLYGISKKLMETGNFEPKDLTALGYDPKEFQSIAPKLYLKGKTAELGSYGANIINKDAFLSASGKTKEDITKGLSETESVLGDLSIYRSLVERYGGELTSRTKAGAKMQQMRDSMALTLKEVKNLGVLNGKDYEILLTQIPNAIGAKWFGRSGTILSLMDSFEQSLISKINSKLKMIGVEYYGTSAIPEL